MDFGEAVQAMKEGKLVSRSGWNGKNMHIYLEEGRMLPLCGGAFRKQDRQYDPVIVMFTAQGTHQPGWLASQADILADDWGVVDE